MYNRTADGGNSFGLNGILLRMHILHIDTTFLKEKESKLFAQVVGWRMRSTMMICQSYFFNRCVENIPSITAGVDRVANKSGSSASKPIWGVMEPIGDHHRHGF
ncbi:hypothetical protein P7H20_25500 [Paenibacillus larvae]|nr:hypothetical protein [Paenibacillus larvae]MDT2277524.1 hypothetical protein [Paenibacillus larvae]